MRIKEFLGGLMGTSLSALGTALQVNEVLQTISLIITICGGLVSLVVVPLLSWYSKAKKDGKITSEELEEGAKIVGDGLKKTQDVIEEKKGGEKNG